MASRNGFTLIETLITALILVTGLAAVAGAFSYGIETNRRIRFKITATALLSTKMEELKATRDLLPGRYSDDASPGYRRTWEITPEMPRRVTVVIYARQPSGGIVELVRATTLIGQDF